MIKNKPSSKMYSGKLLFIGGGKICEAIINGIIKARFIDKKNIFVSEPNRDRSKYIKEKVGVSITQDNKKYLKNASVVVIAVKPNIVSIVLKDIGNLINKNQLVVSVAAGVPINFIESYLQKGCKVARIMPNTPCLVGETAAGISLGKYTKKPDEELIVKMLSTVGKCFLVEEKLLDVVTGLSGSGPAFICMVIQALSDGAVKMGLPRNIADTLAAQTVFGTAKMVMESGLHTGQLKDSVITPGGTTIEGVYKLEQGGFNALLMSAVEAATNKAKELGELFTNCKKPR
ncbi:MAG: pyrroline-5-carboxylate reductase [Candidatus Anammoxibacter sp.]